MEEVAKGGKSGFPHSWHISYKCLQHAAMRLSAAPPSGQTAELHRDYLQLNHVIYWKLSLQLRESSSDCG